MKSTQIIEEFDKLNIQFSAYGYIVQLPDSEVERIKSFMLKAMKTAVEEVTEGDIEYEDGVKIKAKLNYIEEKKRKFFEE